MSKEMFTAMTRFLARFALLLAAAALAGCLYDAPITAQPTGGIDPRALGDWVSADGKNHLKVRRLDEDECILSLNGLLLRGYRSDVGDLRLASVQDIDTGQGRYAYITWRVSDDGSRLVWRAVSRKVIDVDQGKDSAAVRELLLANRGNPALFDAEQVYIRQAPSKKK